MDKQLKKKKILTITAGLCLILVYIMIFSFSSDSAQESSALSVKVTNFLMKMYYRVMGGGRGQVVVGPVATFPLEKIIRKGAHFTEYMAVGFLSYGIVAMWTKKRQPGFWVVVLQIVVSGAFDEIHQYFVPGRYASVKDVLIDTAGGIAGILLLLVVKEIINRLPSKKS